MIKFEILTRCQRFHPMLNFDNGGFFFLILILQKTVNSWEFWLSQHFKEIKYARVSKILQLFEYPCEPLNLMLNLIGKDGQNVNNMLFIFKSLPLIIWTSTKEQNVNTKNAPFACFASLESHFLVVLLASRAAKASYGETQLKTQYLGEKPTQLKTQCLGGKPNLNATGLTCSPGITWSQRVL